jgi:hypothetical protein
MKIIKYPFVKLKKQKETEPTPTPKKEELSEQEKRMNKVLEKIMNEIGVHSFSHCPDKEARPPTQKGEECMRKWAASNHRLPYINLEKLLTEGKTLKESLRESSLSIEKQDELINKFTDRVNKFEAYSVDDIIKGDTNNTGEENTIDTIDINDFDKLFENKDKFINIFDDYLKAANKYQEQYSNIKIKDRDNNKAKINQEFNKAIENIKIENINFGLNTKEKYFINLIIEKGPRLTTSNFPLPNIPQLYHFGDYSSTGKKLSFENFVLDELFPEKSGGKRRTRRRRRSNKKRTNKRKKTKTRMKKRKTHKRKTNKRRRKR